MNEPLETCRQSDQNPEDWFIEANGMQYRDDDLSNDEVRINLIKRRKAKDACYGCALRIPCLIQSLDQRPEYGIMGGYFPEQRREILSQRERRLGGPPRG